MAASENFKKSHSQVLESSPAETQKKISGKYSGSNILHKSLIFIFLLVIVIPLFPLQPPDFINQNLLTNLWELFHLLFVGLAVCYGLFCKKCVEIDCENNSSPNASFSGVLNYPSFFEDGFENFCISDDKNVLNGYKDSFFLDEDKKIRSFTSRNEFGNVRDEYYKPLGLPIRSLRSGIADIPEFTDKTEKCSRLSDDNEGEMERISGLSPSSNVGKKFEEEVVVPWRMEMKEEIRNADSQSHCKPHSVGELEFEDLESRVFQYHVSPSRSFSESESSSSRSTNLDSSSVSFEMSKHKTDSLEREDDLEDSSSVMSSQSKESEMELQQKSKYDFLNSRKAMQNHHGDANQRSSSSSDLNGKSSKAFGAKQRKDSLYSSAKSSKLTEMVPRAKSVRTIRSSKYVSDKFQKADNTSHQTEDNNGGVFGHVEAPVFISPVKKGEPKHSPVDKQKYTSDKVYPLPNSMVSESDSSHQVLNEKESGVNEVDEEELAGSEVDRKADEFITKFREQIRLRR